MKPLPSYALIMTVAMLAHAPALLGGFVWLDHAHLEDGLATVALTQPWQAFTQGFAGTGFYRPLMSLSLSIDAAVGGAPWLYHAHTLLWHALTAAFVAALARSFAVPDRWAMFAGALFAVHPITSLVAGAIAFRSEAMMAAGLLAMLVFLRKGQPWVAAAAVLIAGLSKETGLVLAPLLVLCLHLGRGLSPPPGARARQLGPLVGAWVLALGLRLAYAPAWRAQPLALSASAALGTRLAAVTKYALAYFWPWHSRFCDAFAIAQATSAAALVGGAIVIALGVLALRGPLARLALLATLPALQLVPVMRWWSPHYAYLPWCFVCLMAARQAARWQPNQMWLRALPLAIVPILGGFAFVNAQRFANDETLWGPEVAANPACTEGQASLGEWALQKHDPALAAHHFEQALRTRSDVISYVDRRAALQNLGVAQMQSERFAQAAVAFEAALALADDPKKRGELSHNLAAAALASGDPHRTLALLAHDLDNPAHAHPASLFLLAQALAAQGRHSEAAALKAYLPAR